MAKCPAPGQGLRSSSNHFGDQSLQKLHAGPWSGYGTTHSGYGTTPVLWGGGNRYVEGEPRTFGYLMLYDTFPLLTIGYLMFYETFPLLTIG